MKHSAIVLAAGKGSRMHSEIPKQYMILAGRPLICYALQIFQESFVDEVILVSGDGQEEYCRSEIVGKYGFSKVKKIVPGGKERYDSVYRGLCAAADCDYVYIHDGARPFLDEDILLRARKSVEQNGSCTAGIPAKDTVKIADGNGFVKMTPDRKYVWQIQTPQAFSYSIIKEAYDRLFESGDFSGITDDAMVAERMLSCPIRIFEGSWRNIKITSPEDLLIAEQLQKKYTEI